MKLYRLSVTGYNPGYDEYYGFVVRAKNARTARVLAANKAGGYCSEPDKRWLTKKLTSCRQIKEKGKPEIIASEYFGT